MKLDTHIKLIEAKIEQDRLVILSKNLLRIVSSAALNGGFWEANAIMNVQIPEDSDQDDEPHKNPEVFLRRQASQLKLPAHKTVIVATAVNMQNVEVQSRRFEDVTMTVFVTAGTTFSATAGDDVASKQSHIDVKKIGTINVIMIVDGNLSDSCMVGAISTITEAKTVALRELDLRSYFSGDLASGTITDNVVVACTKRGKPIKYAGTATLLGESIGKSVKETVKKAIIKQDKKLPNRSLTDRLEERGISVTELATLFSQSRPKIGENTEKLSKFTEKLEHALTDQDIYALVIAALRLDDDAKAGLIPEIPIDSTEDKRSIYEILQKAAMDILAKKNDSKKAKSYDLRWLTGEKTGLFTRSVLFAVMCSVYSTMC